MNIYENQITQKLQNVDCDYYKLSTEDRQASEIVNRTRYLISTLQDILNNGGNEDTIKTIDHDLVHLKSLLNRKFGVN